MKAWITAPFDDNGIEEIEIIGEPNDANLYFRRSGSPFPAEVSHFWYREGSTWHRNYDAAITAAQRHREKRVADAAKQIAHVTNLPPIASPQETGA